MPDPGAEPARELSARALADALYDFALTVTWDPLAAAEAVREGVADASPAASTPELFAAVRDPAVRRARPPEAEALDVGAGGAPLAITPDTFESLALTAGDHLDPSDRAVLDLALRKGFEGDDLAAALSVTSREAPGLVSDAHARVDRWLRDYVLARVGTETCPGLAEILTEPPPDLPTLADRVDEHTETCPICDDRRRGLFTPRALLASIPARPAPEELVDHLAEARAGTLEDHAVRRSLWRRAGAVAVVVALAATAVVVGVRLFDDDRVPTIEEPPVGLIQAVGETLDFGSDANVRTLTLVNRGESTARFETRVDVPWLSASPAEGTMERGESTELTLTLDRSSAPEGRSITAVRVVSDAGLVEVDAVAEVAREPVVSKAEVLPARVTPARCDDGTRTATVTARVVEESGLDSVILRWSGAATPDGPAEGQVEMARSGERYEGDLGPFAESGTVDWSVEATDTGGHVGESDPGELEVDEECPEPESEDGEADEA